MAGWKKRSNEIEDSREILEEMRERTAG